MVGFRIILVVLTVAGTVLGISVLEHGFGIRHELLLFSLAGRAYLVALLAV